MSKKSRERKIKRAENQASGKSSERKIKRAYNQASEKPNGVSAHFGPFAADLAPVAIFAAPRSQKHCKIRRFLRSFPVQPPLTKPGSHQKKTRTQPVEPIRVRF